MEKVKLNLKALGERCLDYGYYYVREVDDEYRLYYASGDIVALDGDILDRPEWTRFAIETETGECIYLSQEEFELACIPVKNEQKKTNEGQTNIPEKVSERQSEAVDDSSHAEFISKDDAEIRMKMVDAFLTTLLNSAFDSGIGYADERDVWFDYGVEAVKDRAEEIAEEMKESLLQRVSDKGEEVER